MVAKFLFSPFTFMAGRAGQYNTTSYKLLAHPNGTHKQIEKSNWNENVLGFGKLILLCHRTCALCSKYAFDPMIFSFSYYRTGLTFEEQQKHVFEQRVPNVSAESILWFLWMYGFNTIIKWGRDEGNLSCFCWMLINGSNKSDKGKISIAWYGRYADCWDEKAGLYILQVNPMAYGSCEDATKFHTWNWNRRRAISLTHYMQCRGILQGHPMVLAPLSYDL